MTAADRAIPFLDLAGAHAQVREELDLAWKTVLEHGRFVGGPELERFEEQFAHYCGATACVGVANGTDALELILAALGIGHGDEVIVPGNTFVATAEAVCAVGARPRFVDVCPDTLLIDPAAVDAAVTRNTAAIIAVHLYGQMVDVHCLTALARRHGLALVEDAAQAHGARWAGRRAGTAGVAAGFSFYPGKNLGALGDGGAVVTSDAELARRVRRLANHGRVDGDRYRHLDSGRNSRLDTLQAAVLSAKLHRLDADNARRRELMAHYREGLPPFCVPVAVHPAAEPVHHLAVVQVADRTKVSAALSAAGIGWGLHYPVPCHQQPAFAEFAEPLPVVERAAGRVISLPMFPSLTTDDIARICDVLRGISW
ncbi:DegT/DnrJ/EryC1/StrS family aminotransferase [Gandjariella thermophila]|uniref:Erythromycin biosynthesis sensory transduction protein EryC1 n=1 Tax=Gandjariella thermophila TaxID=1931992 RepID=A0A4D4JCE0_9PSEU|nr:DegT/DnrJ/EryC1/StrS family aminotransferase [Gandjariella thermophila]GDY32039.1 erythromycin biosynthesis sensory transduction protein EryC1 [Gandjariella thermophila]